MVTFSSSKISRYFYCMFKPYSSFCFPNVFQISKFQVSKFQDFKICGYSILQLTWVLLGWTGPMLPATAQNPDRQVYGSAALVASLRGQQSHFATLPVPAAYADPPSTSGPRSRPTRPIEQHRLSRAQLGATRSGSPSALTP